MLTRADLSVLGAPGTGAPLRFQGRERDGAFWAGVLRDEAHHRQWCVEEGIARLYEPAQVTGPDALMRQVYDGLPSLHDPGVRLGLPLYGGGTEREIREGYLPCLDLAGLRPRADGGPLRVLEVSVGTGANLPLLLRDLPPGLPVELWGLDLSLGMMRLARKKIAAGGLRSPDGSPIRLLMADAHHLPFADASFDRVFHVGGIAAFRDPRRALAEMARVARPGSPIVVVDENLDPERENNAWHRLMFKLLTAWDGDVHVPREHVPFDAEVLADFQVSRFYYCLAFRMPAA
jgi:SAM-dependent methyltransferase